MNSIVSNHLTGRKYSHLLHLRLKCTVMTLPVQFWTCVWNLGILGWILPLYFKLKHTPFLLLLGIVVSALHVYIYSHSFNKRILRD